MKSTMVVGFGLLMIASLLSVVVASSAFPSTVPAFLWSSHEHPIGEEITVKEAVRYQMLSPRNLVKAVISEGGLSNLLCSGKHDEQSTNLALIFIGKQIQSSEISKPRNADPVLLNLLKESFMKSNLSLAFPYVSTSDSEAIESSLISEFADACGQNLEMDNIVFSESCSLEGDNFKKLSDVNAVHDHLISRAKAGTQSQGSVIVFCHGGVSDMKTQKHYSEGRFFSELLQSLEQLNAKYTALYVSDPSRPIEYPSHRELQRFLAEGAFGNASGNSTMCDGLCQIKSSLLEGLFVGLVLLVILISGLCCMMGIDTPTRFETPQDS
ncbi:transferase [Lithospermum erythrorhizon]|uniref:Transferase n=1 Tax=Lithospermum erythrorhizon TaxID=34254 RepID=A0AAV3NIJ5_LITER